MDCLPVGPSPAEEPKYEELAVGDVADLPLEKRHGKE
jgi:hypothetical protein